LRAGSRARGPRPGRSTASWRRRYARDVDQREQQPAPQQAPAIADRVWSITSSSRAGAPAIEQRLRQLEVAARLLVDDQIVGALEDLQARTGSVAPAGWRRA